MKKWILVFLKGMAMGAADVVPGVSGGTIAFITGIYERLINAIKSINLANLKLLFTGKIKEFWKNIDANFLICLVAGIATSLLSIAKVMTYLLVHQPILLWAFFFGLIVASTWFVAKPVKWNWKTILSFVVFLVLAFFLTSPENQPLNTSDSYWYIFLCGAIAICAMILPGISGSFILVLLGEYFFILKSLTEFNIPVLLIFIVGALIGIVTFANVVSYLFSHFKMVTLAALTGFMVGSLNKIWPWKFTLSTYTNHAGDLVPLTEKNVLPSVFEELTGRDPQIACAIICLVAGLALVFVLEFIALRLRKPAADAEIQNSEDKIQE